MPTDVTLRCTCGTVRGFARQVSGASGNRLVCYCDDCQSYAYFLERADDVLDAHGGTDIYQMTPRALDITEGADQLRCVRLTGGGSMRWYTACCRTPVGNTLASPQMPFVGVVHNFMHHAAGRGNELGPVRAGLHGRYATGDTASLDTHAKVPLPLILRSVRILLVARIRGHHAPSPFFDSETGKPVVEPRVLTEQELREVEARRDASSG